MKQFYDQILYYIHYKASRNNNYYQNYVFFLVKNEGLLTFLNS